MCKVMNKYKPKKMTSEKSLFTGGMSFEFECDKKAKTALIDIGRSFPDSWLKESNPGTKVK